MAPSIPEKFTAIINNFRQSGLQAEKQKLDNMTPEERKDYFAHVNDNRLITGPSIYDNELYKNYSEYEPKYINCIWNAQQE